MKLSSPAVQRNRDAIADVLARWLTDGDLVLEVASGTGEHVAAFAARFPALTWQPSDPDAEARGSIDAWRTESATRALLAPIALDASSPSWPVAQADAVLCINMVHIAPWAATLGLFAGAAGLLGHGAPLILYGPYRRSGVPTASSNEAFDASLKARNADWGLRSVEEVEAAAAHFALIELVEMPANNLMLLFRRTRDPAA